MKMIVNSGCCMNDSIEPSVQIDTYPRDHNADNVRTGRQRAGSYHVPYDAISGGQSHFKESIQVSKRWHPEDACRPVVDEAPTFFPSEEEFKDTLAYIAKIRQKAEIYGICRIIPPPSWKPKCPLKEKTTWNCAKFTTRIQQIDKLQNREPVKKKSRNNALKRRKRRKRFRFGMTRRRFNSSLFENDCAGSDSEEKFGFQSGSDFSFGSFQQFANRFKEFYFGMEDPVQITGSDKRWEPSVEEIEGEYWRVVEKSAEEVEVHYGADLETGNFSSGFLKAHQPCEGEINPHAVSGWNLNNLPRLSGSLLSFESSDISGVLVPWLYVGMCFSSFCWHVEDHHLYSLNYMHFGDPKVWYGVAGRDASRLEEAMKKHLPELFEEQPYLLNELVTQLSPSTLKSEGVPVYRAVQNAGEFVLTFPRAYHAGFNCGFNCAEAVNVAPIDWLSRGQWAVELYSEQCRKTSLSHDKLLLRAAVKAIKSFSYLPSVTESNSEVLKWKNVCGKNGMLTEAVKERIIMEEKRRQNLPIGIQTRRVNDSFDSHERECTTCFYDLYLSAGGCECSPYRFSCLNHMNMLCSCDSTRKFILFRYDMNELHTLLEALEGDGSAMKKWTSIFASLSDNKKIVSDGSEPSLLLDMKDFSGVCKSSQPDIDKSAPQPKIQHQINERDCHEIKEFAPVKASLKGEGVSEIDEVVYQESVDMKNLESFESISPIGCNATKPIKCEEATCKGHRTVVSDLNLDEACPEDEVLNEVINECSGPMVWMGSQVLMGEQAEKNRLSEKTSKKTEKIQASRCLETDKLIWASRDMRTQVLFEDSPYCFRHFVEAASENVEDSNTSVKTMPFGFDLWPLKQDLSPYCQSTDIYSRFSPESSVTEMNLSKPMYKIELLHLGTIVPETMWCSKEAIFPKGFKSRINFTSLTDPSRTCHYTSEVLPGVFGPLFKVTLEDSPDVNFVSTSPNLCWGLVQKELEEKFAKFHSKGSDSINGLQMFGFQFQPIVQAIESLDRHHCCIEYWAAKVDKTLTQPCTSSSSRGSKDVSDGKITTFASNYLLDGICDVKPTKLFGVHLLEKEHLHLRVSVKEEVNQVLGGLIGNATSSELDMLLDICCASPANSKRAAAFVKLLREAKKRRCL